MSKTTLDLVSNANEFRVLEYVSELENLISGGVKIPLTSDKIVVKSDRIYELLDGIRNDIPKELKEAVKIANAVKDLIHAAHEQSETIIKEAKDYAEKMLNESDILEKAKLESERILAEAIQYRKTSREEVQKYLVNVLSATEDGIDDILNQIKSAKNELIEADKEEKIVSKA